MIRCVGSHTAGRILLRVSADLWVHRGNGIRALTKTEKSWEGEVKLSRIQLSVTEVSLVELATRPPSRKGPCGHPPKVWKYGVQLSVEKCTAYPKAHRML